MKIEQKFRENEVPFEKILLLIRKGKLDDVTVTFDTSSSTLSYVLIADIYIKDVVKVFSPLLKKLD